MQTYKICLLRHGLTRANEEGLYIGRTDLPLSPRGFASLMERKEQHAYPPASRFLLRRCPDAARRCRYCTRTAGSRMRRAWRSAILGNGREERFLLQNDPRFVRWLTGESREIPGGEDTGQFQRRVLGASAASWKR